MKVNFKNNTGQILLEIIIAGLLVIFVTLAITQAISSSIRGIDMSIVETTAVFLSQEEVEAMRAITKEDWHNIVGLATSSANKYIATTTASRWVVASTTDGEIISLNNINYTRYFYLDEVYRSSTSTIVASSTPGGVYDPSTIKVTTYVGWTNNNSGESDVFSQVFYATRVINEVYNQTDWSGGGVGAQVIPYSQNTTTFATSTSVNFSATGTIRLQTQ
ncbi:MAG: hypothetical protein QMD50_03210 [Patescibacteria group bacterium]|nr:hypothetical protein [Patescibacteria group bacterium]